MPIRLSDAVARLKNRRKRQKHETVEQATAAPGEKRPRVRLAPGCSACMWCGTVYRSGEEPHHSHMYGAE